ncbi:MAG: hypothetical protein LBG90_06195 [Spirochaetaceae bacterium]|jgi:hypothetical protein|nr:hypothetical protein [Spirochaetaceae bacterium]
MNPLNIIRLDLYGSLYYRPDPKCEPFGAEEIREEALFCFEIASDQYLSIEPEYDRYLGPLLFAGAGPTAASGEACELPAGLYLFAQVRDVLCREDIVWMAMEIQKDGLWERLDLGNRLYLRYLYEDASAVTQLFRPYKK